MHEENDVGICGEFRFSGDEFNCFSFFLTYPNFCEI